MKMIAFGAIVAIVWALAHGVTQARVRRRARRRAGAIRRYPW